MIEVLREGKTSETHYVSVCRRCTAQFRFTLDDAKLIIDPREGNYLEIMCPTEGCRTICTKAAD